MSAETSRLENPHAIFISLIISLNTPYFIILHKLIERAHLYS